MGSIDPDIHIHENYGAPNESSTGKSQTSDFPIRSVNIDRLAQDQHASVKGLENEIVLLSWLVTLMRSRQGSNVRFEWAFGETSGKKSVDLVASSLTLSEVLPRLDDTVQQAAVAIDGHIGADLKSDATTSIHLPSLILSTDSLSRACGEAKDDIVIHLQVQSNATGVEIRPIWWTEDMPEHAVSRHIDCLVDTITTCVSAPSTKIDDLLQLSNRDLRELWTLNSELPETYSFCMTEMVSKWAQQTPNKIAIHSWDGDLTYRQIDDRSTLLAHRLHSKGVQPHDFVPLSFEKSKWTIIAVLAVMKAGATFVLMDSALPTARLHNMATQVNAKTMLSSREQQTLSDSILGEENIIIVEDETFQPTNDGSHINSQLPPVDPNTLMYIIFTSGSTGTPKGVKVSHKSYTSSAVPRAAAVGYNEESRVLDFASYAFDVSIDSMLLTLGNGGCLCIPSDEDRLNNINDAMQRMRVTYAGLTPSVARILDSSVIASLSALGLGGEAVSPRDVAVWGKMTRIVIGYGPCECTIGCTVNSSAATGRPYISIGPGNGANMWIVDPDDHESLLPIGAVGELLVEGPIVGQGYLNDPEKTQAAFIEDPKWLVAGFEGHAGRRGRLYKTGDLGKYDPDGSGCIVFVGRKDTQVKLRGQRVELGEIESQIQARLPSGANVIAEVVSFKGHPTLLAFLCFPSPKSGRSTDLGTISLDPESSALLSKMSSELGDVLPRYMVPTAFIPVTHIPVLISGKTDRKQLRQFGASFDLRKVSEETKIDTTKREFSAVELQLRSLWGEVLQIDSSTIKLRSNFFALGGDSLSAMKLVTACRNHALDLSVVNTFNHPTLEAMAGVVMKSETESGNSTTRSFSMLTGQVTDVLANAAQICVSHVAVVEDIYPCTPTQESLFTFSIKSATPYVAQRVAEIPSRIFIEDWKAAWEEVVARNSILRTRLAQLDGEPGLQQVVLKGAIAWRHADNLDEYLNTDKNDRMDFGQGLARYAIISASKTDKRYMVWTIHHVVYDGWSEPLILEQLKTALQNRLDGSIAPAEMRDFSRFVHETDHQDMRNFWRQELAGAVGPYFPRLPTRDYLPTPDVTVEREIAFCMSKGSSFTVATIIRAAWALVASQFTGHDDVVFGETLTGRDISLPGVESIIGPLIATVPMRIRIQRGSTVEEYLQAVQKSVLTRTPYQHIGWQNIRKVSQDAQYASETGTGIVIQPEAEHVGTELGFQYGDAVHEALHFNPYPLMLAFGLRKDGFRVCANFDSSLIETSQMERVLAQLEAAFLRLATSLSKKVSEISCLHDDELHHIWRWNCTAPLPLDETSQSVQAAHDLQPGSSYPSAVVKWVCQPRNPSLLSPIGAIGEVWLEHSFSRVQEMNTPTWLLTGSVMYPGRLNHVQATGDLVELKDDGTLVFVGKKSQLLQARGNALEVSALDSLLAEHLSSLTYDKAIVSRGSVISEQAMDEQDLVVFVEETKVDSENFEILSGHQELCWEGSKAEICSTVSQSLIATLKKLDRAIRGALPSYMVPSTYIVLKTLPIDRAVIDGLASKIPLDILSQLREGLEKAWNTSTSTTKLSNEETILRSAWAEILKIPVEAIDIDDNFFRLGGDSVLAMKMASNLRAKGHRLTVADIFQNMRLADAAKVLKTGDVVRVSAEKYHPFSTIQHMGDKEAFLSKHVRPQLADAQWSIVDVLPVTDTQALDIRDTIGPLRTSVQYTMLYFERRTIKRENILEAISKLVAAQDILRTVFVRREQNSFFQVVFQGLEIPVIEESIESDLEESVNEVCFQDIESDFSLGAPFAKFLLVNGKNDRSCLIIRLSHAQYDGISLPRMLQDLEALYTGSTKEHIQPFASYISRISDKPLQDQAQAYWNHLLQGSSLSVIEGKFGRPGDCAIFRSKPTETITRPGGPSTSVLLTSAWALVLARRLHSHDITFGSITSGRSLDMDDIESVAGPCYSFFPVRVLFETAWTSKDLLQFVQQQSRQSAPHEFMNFSEIAAHCTQWTSTSGNAVFFDSVVHHHPDDSDTEKMLFAGQQCKVDILNPHGDAAHPLKVITFVKGGKTHAGVVGSERDSELVEALLDEITVTIQELGGEGKNILRLE